MDDNWRLTQTQISAACVLHRELLPNWQFADRSFEFLKGLRFESPEICLLAVVSLDALYGTNLRYHPGSREDIARYVFSIRERLLKPARTDHDLVEDIVRCSSSGASISFASKFCHFFVSAEYPIYDKFVCYALKRLIPIRERRRMEVSLDRYSGFSKACRLMTELREPTGETITIRQLDQCLWLMGQCLDFDRPSKKQTNAKESKNEVWLLFDKHPNRLREILPNYLRTDPHHQPL